MKITNRVFSGEAPKLSARLLQDEQAQDAIDCDLVSGELRPLKTSQYVADSGITDPETIFELDDEFISFAAYTDIAETPVDAAVRRLFLTGANGPQQGTIADIRAGNTYLMGVPAPLAIPVITKQSDSTVVGAEDEATSYLITFVNKWAEEGPPSPPSETITIKRGDVYSVTGGFGDNLDYEDYAIVAWRLYRLSGIEYRFVSENPIASNVAINDTSDALNEILASDTNYPPSVRLRGLHIMSNGIAAGFIPGTKTVVVSEPNNPNAMPYSFTVSSEVVGLSSYDNTLVVGTKGFPEIATIIDPRTIIPVRLTEREPCLTRRAMVQMEDGVAYPAPSGLFYVGRGGQRMLTNDLHDRNDWQALQPSTFRAAYRDGQYVAFYGTGGNGGGWIFDTREANATVRRLTQVASAVTTGTGTDALYYPIGDQIFQFDSTTTDIVYRWRSKDHGGGSPFALTCYRILSNDLFKNPNATELAAIREREEADRLAFAARIALGDLGGEIAGFTVADFTVAGDASGRLTDIFERKYVKLTVWGDCEVVDEITVYDQEEHRLNYADRKRLWTYQLEGNADVTQVDLAGSISEMHTGS